MLHSEIHLKSVYDIGNEYTFTLNENSYKNVKNLKKIGVLPMFSTLTLNFRPLNIV